ncbi:MAG TPA: hypothetical protein PLZ01_16555 [bacterium]|nr:hypothetical protein [bacterium]
MHILSPDFNSPVRQFIKWAGCVLLLPLFLHAADYVTINQAGYLPHHPKQALGVYKRASIEDKGVKPAPLATMRCDRRHNATWANPWRKDLKTAKG